MRIVNDESLNGLERVRNDLLSRIYENKIINQRSGSSLTFSSNGQNFTVGGAYQQVNLNGKYESPNPLLVYDPVNNKFSRWLPYFEYNGSLSRNTWLNFDYEKAPMNHQSKISFLLLIFLIPNISLKVILTLFLH
ncbi:MAG: hypothetical protein IPO48_07175 [Saprospiraceae bacterium]|nr:hypothetical protein [Saprospiraceae bacterium]